MMAKKKKSSDVDKLVDDLIKDVNDDRQLLRTFTEELIKEYNGEAAVGIAENVAKLFDAMTRQNNVRAAAIKNASKILPETDDEDDDDLQMKIGLPFKNNDDSIGN